VFDPSQQQGVDVPASTMWWFKTGMSAFALGSIVGIDDGLPQRRRQIAV
jgi:hypothetical protein